ncbi:MAG: DUF2520 domain-containing protein [Bacteroidetes bacterium]|nr:DUF2520 domain-containing protein [Bacteroidota bacterium]
MEDIVIIGTGNTATILGRQLKQAGHRIVQVAGRNMAPATLLAAELNALPCTNASSLNRDASMYLLAVPDRALAGIQEEWKLPPVLTVHTAGAVSLNVLKDAAAEYGVLYPLQSLRKEIKRTPELPLLVDGNTDRVRERLLGIAKSISALAGLADDAQRLQLHLAAVLVNNFTNHLYALAEAYCDKQGLDFSFLLPLIRETALRLEGHSPHTVQTGPAVRNDAGTIERHLALLEKDAALKEIYTMMTKSIQSFHP